MTTFLAFVGVIVIGLVVLAAIGFGLMYVLAKSMGMPD